MVSLLLSSESPISLVEYVIGLRSIVVKAYLASLHISNRLSKSSYCKFSPYPKVKLYTSMWKELLEKKRFRIANRFALEQDDVRKNVLCLPYNGDGVFPDAARHLRETKHVLLIVDSWTGLYRAGIRERCHVEPAKLLKNLRRLAIHFGVAVVITAQGAVNTDGSEIKTIEADFITHASWQSNNWCFFSWSWSAVSYFNRGITDLRCDEGGLT
ncbi:hypothetical protein M5689_005524 [Euphorbia peplus]|nr:hypothetical protein M5689_005524 [Euphorbia peplus]